MVFWQKLGPGHLDKFWARADDKKKHNFPVLGVPKQKNKTPRYPEWLFATFLHFTFGSTGPPRAGNRKIRGLSAILASDGRWHLEKSRARPENGNSQLPGDRGPAMEKKNVTTVSGVVVRKSFGHYVLADRTPTGGKSQNMG